MICAIMQPTYIPWVGYFDMIDKVDLFVFYDDVQLTKRSWQTRNRLRNVSNEFWLTLPIKKTSSRDNLLIKDAVLNNNEKWKKKHLVTISNCYSKSEYFDELYSLIEPIYNQSEMLSQLNIGLIKMICERLNIHTKLIKSSSLYGIEGVKDHRLVSICKNIQINHYLSPQGSAKYINRQNIGGDFLNQNIKLFYHDFEHPLYKQVDNNFIPYLGIFDLIFNSGFDEALKKIRFGRKPNLNYDFL
tara:strand:+ start:3118 stop:3849 length:732 start_codon:yes stop_codon:yes gene_type:complete